MRHCNVVALVVIVVFLVTGGQALAVSFTNGDFSPGFAGWNGQLSGSSVDNANLSSDPHFSASSGIATISYSDLGDPYWNFTLSQSFETDPLLAAGYKLQLSFWMQLELPQTNAFGDLSGINNHIVSATLNSLDLINTTDSVTVDRLTSGYQFNVDVTDLAGTNVLLAFTLGDLDFSATDYLRVGNISFSQVAPAVDPPVAPVPEPGTLLLLGAGLVGVGLLRRRKVRG